MTDAELKPIQRLLIGHGALILLLGFVMGFGFAFFLLGEIRLWPIPGRIVYQMPGTYDAWRMAHMEGVINGFALWLAAIILPILPGNATLLRRISFAFIITAWTFAVASCFDPLFADSRGLSFDPPFTNRMAFLLFMVGIIAIIWASVMIAYMCLRRARA